MFSTASRLSPWVLFIALLSTAACDRGAPRAEAAAAAAATAPAPIVEAERLPQLAGAMRARPGFMGGVLVAKGDQILFRQVYGAADIETGEPLALTSRFRLASLSKQFTAAAVLKLQDEGRLSVDDPVCRWIQPCPAAWAPVRISHLLSHTSGIPDLMARPGWGVRRVTPATLAELTEDSKAFGLQFEPGTKIRYDNAAFNLAAAIVEQVSGEAFEDYVRTALLEPLGMADTGFGDGEGLVAGHATFPAGVTPQRQANVSIIPGAGAMYSTLDDMLKWERGLHGGRVLSAESYRQMIANHGPAADPAEARYPPRAWGYGLFVRSLGERVEPGFRDGQIYHTGSWSGFRNLATYQPQGDVTVIVLSNNYHQTDEVLLISQQAVAEALGRPFPVAIKSAR